MTYHFSEFVDASFDEAITQVAEALKQEGMGVLTEIDVQAAFKKKLDIDFRQYKILGACHPQIASQMIQAEDRAGVLYPGNVVVQEHTDGRVEVSAVDSLAMFAPVENPQAKEIAIAASQTVQGVIDHLPAAQLHEYAV